MSKPTLQQLTTEVSTLKKRTTATDAKLTSVLTSIEEIRSGLGLPMRQSVGDRLRNNWISLVTTALSVTGLILAFFYFWIPRSDKRAQDEAVTLVNTQFEVKLKEHHFDELQSDVAKIDGQMTVFIPLLQSVVQKEMKTIAVLPARDFQDNLARVNVVLAVAKATRAYVPDSVVGDVRAKLVQASRSTPYFWGAATALIDYRSITLPSDLPNCLAKTPVIKTLQAIPGGELHYPFDLKISPPTYEDCKIDLSAIPPQDVVTYLTQAPKFPLEFHRSLVIYKKGNIPLLSITSKLVFENCAFNIVGSGSEGDQSKHLVNDLLLAESQTNVTVSGKVGE